MDCESCKAARAPEAVPYIVHEGAMARMERVIKRLWVALVLLLVLLVATNGLWIWYESQWEEVVTETYTSETDGGGTAIVNRDGEVRYGEGYLYEDNEALS